jgi:hypothetical protein
VTNSYGPTEAEKSMTINTAYDALMEEICVGLGFCGCIKDGRPLHVRQLIPSSGPVTADQFVEWVFLADNMNPNTRPMRWENLKGKVRQAFLRHMGAEVVDAKLLKWSDGKPDREFRVDEPLYVKVEVWKRLSAERAIRYNCIQHIQSGEFRVLTADFVEAGGAQDQVQHGYFIDAILACDRSDPGPQSWSGSLEGAIASHDEEFGN